MLLDWITNEGGWLISWWLLTLAAGIAVFPLFFRVMRGLPGRGYALARAGGLMLTGFIFWILNILRLLSNTSGSTIVAWLLVLGVGVLAYVTRPERERESIGDWLRQPQNRRLIIATEVLFVVLFAIWAAVRALNPDLVGTEKPMEMAFLSAIRRTTSFPPPDPWMSGYAISYYHFGYILIAMVANMTAIPNAAAFNLGIALLFALTGVGAFGVAYELVRSRAGANGARNKQPTIVVGLLAVIFSVVMGNLGTALIEIPYQTRTAPEWYLAWMNVEGRDSTYSPSCPPTGTLDPAQWCFWWWFRHSRVVRDLDLSGSPTGNQPITEFPNFSYVLADMHPHVLSMPFFMLTVGLGANLVLGRRRLQPWEVALYAIYVGGMVFLNSWDAIMLVFIIGAEALRRLVANGTGWFVREDWLGILGFGTGIAALTGIFYLPFFIGFRSQAAGFVPNLVFQTQFQQFFLMFGPFLVILGGFLALEARAAGKTFNPGGALALLGGSVGLGLVVMIVLSIAAWLVVENRAAVYQVVDQSGGLWAALPAVLARRLHGIVTQLVLILMIFVVFARLFAREPRSADGRPGEARAVINYSPATAYALLLTLAGAVLALAPEFVYLRDGFGSRINTLFKLYYQAWLFWSVASAYAVWWVLREVRAVTLPGWVRPAFTTATALLIILCLIYPPFAVAKRAFQEGGHLDGFVQKMTLDGGPSMVANADEYAVVECLNRLPREQNHVIAEATRDSLAYTRDWGRISALTGIPTLRGWDNHERQWRGATFADADTLVYFEAGLQKTETRAQAIATLYNTTDPQLAEGVIRRYGITLIYVGVTERNEFEAGGLAKFEGLQPLCASGMVAVYPAEALVSPAASLN